MVNIKPFIALKNVIRPETPAEQLPSYLNLWAVDDGILVGADCQMSLVYEIQGVDLLLKSDTELEMFYGSVKTALNILPENVTVQFVVQVRRGNDELIDRHRAGLELTDDISSYLSDINSDFYRKACPYRKRYLMYFTIHPGQDNLRNLKPDLTKLFYPDYKKLTKEFADKHSKDVKEAAGVFVKSLVHTGIKAKQLNDEEIVKLLYEHFNPGRAELLDIKGINKEHTLRSQLAFNAGDNLFSHYASDGHCHMGVNLYVRPEDVLYTYLPNLIGRIDDEYDIVVTIHKVNKDKVFEGPGGLKMQRTITALTNFNKNDINNAATQKIDQITEFIKMIETSKESVFELSFCVVLHDTDLVKLRSRANNCLAAFKDISEAEGIIDDMNHYQLYLSCMPNHSMYNPRRHITHASGAAMFLPLFQYWTGCDTPKMLYLTRQNELLPVDIYDRSYVESSNMLIVGGSGSGKSFNVNTMIETFYMSSLLNHVIVVDAGDSYRVMCEVLGGQRFDIGFTEDFGLNPFPLKEIAFVKNDKSGEYEMDPDWITYLSLLIRTMLNRSDMSGQESLIIERAITSAYRHLPAGVDTPIISNLLYQLSHYTPKGVPEGRDPQDGDPTERRIALKFAKNIEKYTEGSYGKLFNRRMTLNLDARFTLFEIQKLREHDDIKKIIIFVIRNLIWKKLYNRSLCKLIIMDECWKLMQDPVSAELVGEFYRVVRKFNGSIAAVTQNLADVTDSPVHSAIKINSPIKFFGRLKGGIEHLANWDLSPKEIEYISALKPVLPTYSEIALKFGDMFRVLRHRVPKPLYWVCTSDPKDYIKHQAMHKKYPGSGTLDIIKRLASGEEAA